ncbi:hypothetical protein BJV74DRAFT_846353 [Russula compacta]|nr:hypothetical protein BJV74DRAFT_846353 [Russula compacta]
MRGPFPALTHLHLGSTSSGRMILPDAFLGESAPSLQIVAFNGIAFPALPKLLLTTSHLVTLRLRRIPNIGYISPEAMAACLVALPNLEHLGIEYEDWMISHPKQTTSPPFTRTVLPTLTTFHFEGASKYLDDFIARFDAPVLQTFLITLNGPIFHISQLYRFITQAERSRLPTRAMVNFSIWIAYIKLLASDSFNLIIRRGGRVWSIALVCQELSPFLSHVERLGLHGQPNTINMDPSQWLELFHPFIAVQSLHVSMHIMPLIAPALQELTGARAIEVLPELRILSLEKCQPSRSVQEAIESFVAARQLSNHPVVIQQQ